MKTELDLDTTEWRKALKQFSKGTRYEGAASLNGSMASILFKAPHSVIRKSYRQTKSGITASLRKNGDMLIINMATKWLKEQGQKINETSIGLAAQRIIAARWKSVRYIIAGWAPAARDFGATRIRPPGSRSTAAKGHGRKATEGNLEAVAVNYVGKELVDGRIYAEVSATMQQAVNKEAHALKKFYYRRLDRLTRKHSAR